jgi:hypothetical protein
MKLIGLAGGMGSGKDTVADLLRKEHGFEVVAWADPIKRLAHWLFQVDLDVLFGASALRSTPLPRSSVYWRGVDYRMASSPLQVLRLFQSEQRDRAWEDLRGWIHAWACSPEEVTVRKVLQILGTEWARSIDPDVWTRTGVQMIQDLQDGRGVYDRRVGMCWMTGEKPIGIVIPDTRFRSECEAVRKSGGHVWWIDPGTRVASSAHTHASEPAYEDLGDLVWTRFMNDGPLDGLSLKVTNTLQAMP